MARADIDCAAVIYPDTRQILAVGCVYRSNNDQLEIHEPNMTRLSKIRTCAWSVATSLCLLTSLPTLADNLALRVEVSGCASISSIGACTLNDSRTLTLWVLHSLRDTVSIKFDSRDATIQASHRIQNGTRFKLDVPLTASKLSISDGVRETSIALISNSRPTALEIARTLNREGKLEEAIVLLNEAIPSLDAYWKGTALRLLGQAQRRLGSTDAAQQSLSQSIAADLKVGKHSDALRTSTVIVYSHLDEGDFRSARQVLSGVVAPAPIDADSAYNLDYFSGLLAYNTSNTRTALERLSEAALQAQRTGTSAQRLYAELLLAVQMQRVGRVQEALAYLSRWSTSIPNDIRPCEHSLVLTNMGWTALLLLESGVETEDPTAQLLRAHELSQTQCGPQAKINTRTNLALARWHANDLTGAQYWIDQARDTNAMHLRSALWLLDIEARIALAQEDFDLAHKNYSQLESLAKATLSTGAQWRALAGYARTFAASGDTKAALDAYMEADLFLIDRLPSIPIDQGREALIAAHSNVTREHISLLLDAQRYEEAFAVAREARVSALRTVNVAQRIEQLPESTKQQWENLLGKYHQLRSELEVATESAWMLPADELAELIQENTARKNRLRQILSDATDVLRDLKLPALAPPHFNELLVLIQKLPNSWAIFTHDGTTLRVSQPSCQSSVLNQQLECLLDTASDQIAAAPLLRLLLSGAMVEVDVHAIRVNNQPLVTQVPVVFGLDIVSPLDMTTRGNRALLVADSGGDLAAARGELKSIANMLTATGTWKHESLTDRKARLLDVLEGINRSDLFHFAGHARFEGEYGWGSELKLAQDSGLGVSDVLTLEHAPELVVLSGCETAKTTSTSVTQSMSLANAFLLAGSKSVLAATRPVRDETAQRLVRAFYSHWINGQSPEVALQRAQLALLESHPQDDWAAYRLISQ